MNNFDFFITSMPDSRKADYYIGCLDGSVFIDFVSSSEEQVFLKRISFDGYGCYQIEEDIAPMNLTDSREFIKMVDTKSIDQGEMELIIKRVLYSNNDSISEDALLEYNLL